MSHAPPTDTREREASGLDPALVARLDRWRRRWLWLTASGGLAAVLAVFFGALLGAVLLDRFRFLGGTDLAVLRLAVFLLPALCLVAVLAWILLRRPGLASVARRAEARFPSVRGQLLSAVELVTTARDSRLDSVDMRRETQHRAASRAGALDARGVYPVRGSGASRAAIAALLFAGLHLVALCIPGSGWATSALRVLARGDDLERVAVNAVEVSPRSLVLPRGENLVIEARVAGPDLGGARFHWQAVSGSEGTGEAPPFLVPAPGREPVAPTGPIRMDPVSGEEFNGPAGARPETASSGAGDGTEPRRFRLRLEQVRQSFVGWVRAGDGESAAVSITVSPRPRILRFTKTYHPPAWLQGPSRTVVESNGDLEALEGSRVDVRVECDQKLDEARVRMSLDGQADRTLTLAVDGHAASLEGLVLERSGSYRLHLTAAATGFGIAHRPPQEIRIVVDRSPEVRILEPRGGVVVPADGMLVPRLRLSDDTGLAALEEVISINGAEAFTRTLAVLAGPLEKRWSQPRELLSLDLSAGDRLSILYRARDLAGNVGQSAELGLLVSARGHRPLAADLRGAARRFVETLHDLEERASALGLEWRRLGLRSRGAATGEVPSARRLLEELRSWLAVAARGLEEVETALEASRRAAMSSELLDWHATLNAVLNDHMSPAVSLFASLADGPAATDVPELFPPVRDRLRLALDSWQGGQELLRRLRVAAGVGLFELEIDRGTYEELAWLRARLDSLAAPLSPDGSIGERERARVSRERAVLGGLFARVASALRSLPSDLPGDEALRRARRDAIAAVGATEASVARVTGPGDDRGWSEVVVALSRSLDALEPIVETLRAAGRAERARVAALEVSDSAAVATLAGAIEPVEAVWRELIAETARGSGGAGDRDLEPLRPHLRRAVATADWIHGDALARPRLDPLLDRLGRSLAASSRRERGDMRFAEDLFLARTIVEPWISDIVAALRGELARAILDRDASRMDEALERLGDADGQATRRMVETARLLALLELSRDVSLLDDRVRDLVRVEESSHAYDEVAGGRDEELGEIGRAVTRLRERSRERGAADLAEALGRIDGQLAALSAAGDDDPGARARFARRGRGSELDEISRGLNLLREAETPSIREARLALRALAPDLASTLGVALEHSRRALVTTRAALEGAPPPEDGPGGLVALEERAGDSVARARRLVQRRRLALEPHSRGTVELARDLDGALALLRPPEPAALELLLAASTASAGDRRLALSGAAGIQAERVRRLEILVAALRSADEQPDAGSRDALRDLERELGVYEALEASHSILRALSGIREGEQDVLARTRELADSAATEEEARRSGAPLARLQRGLEERLGHAMEDSAGSRVALRELMESLLVDVSAELGVLADEQSRFDDRRWQRERESSAVLASALSTLDSVRSGLQDALLRDWPLLREQVEATSPGRGGDGPREALDGWQRALEALLPARSVQPGETSPRASTTEAELERFALELRTVMLALAARRRDLDPVEQHEVPEALRAAVRRVDRIRAAVRAMARGWSLAATSGRADPAELRRRRESLEGLWRGALAAARAIGEAAGPLDGDDRPVAEALRSASEEVAWAAQLLEDADGGVSWSAVDERLAAALARLRVQRGELGPLVDAMALVAHRLEGLSDRAREAGGELLAARRGRATLRRLLGEKERGIADRTEHALVDLEHAARHAARLDDSRAGAVSEASILLGEGALPALETLVEQLQGTAPLVPDYREADDDPGRRAGEALRGARSVLQEGLRRHPEGGRASGPAPAPSRLDGAQTARAAAAAIDHMVRAASALEAGRAARASGEQEAASRELDRALRALARELSPPGESVGARARADAEAAAGDSPPASGNGAATPSPGGTGENLRIGPAGDPVLRDLLSGGVEASDWAHLPSRLKREILRGRREAIPEAYRARVEAYFRAIAEAARNGSGAVDD